MPIYSKQSPVTPVSKPVPVADVGGRVPRKAVNGRRQAAQTIECISEDGWNKRFEKRLVAIQIVKAMPEYQCVRACSDGQPRSSSRPRTPNPYDVTISKRRWEAEVAMWRSATREQYMLS
jgi:hypothetical protein